MTFLVLMAISIAVAASVYLLLSRDIFRMIVGLAMLGAAVNLVLFSVGRFASLTPPLLAGVEDAQAAAANPLSQALVLTAIVISFALLCFALILGARLHTTVGSSDTQEMKTTEPAALDPVKPPELED